MRDIAYILIGAAFIVAFAFVLMPRGPRGFLLMEQNMRQLVDIKTVAEMLGGLHPEHVRQRILKRPDFPRPFRIAGRVMLDKSEVSEWIDMQRQPIDGRTAQKSRNNVR